MKITTKYVYSEFFDRIARITNSNKVSLYLQNSGTWNELTEVWVKEWFIFDIRGNLSILSNKIRYLL